LGSPWEQLRAPSFFVWLSSRGSYAAAEYNGPSPKRQTSRPSSPEMAEPTHLSLDSRRVRRIRGILHQRQEAARRAKRTPSLLRPARRRYLSSESYHHPTQIFCATRHDCLECK
jgi:hypothetical protein